MDNFLDIQQRVKGWFANYEMYLLPALKFLTMMAVLLMMNWHLGYRLLQMRWILVILVSLVCSLLPWSGLTVISGVYLLGHVSALTWEGAALLATLFLIAVMVHYLLLPGGSFLLVLVPMMFYLRIPFLIPLLAGIFGSGLTFIPVGLGVAVYYLMAALEKNAIYLLDPSHTIQERFLQILQTFAGNRMMVLAMVAFCLVTLAVFAISRLSLDYAPFIAVGSGCVLMLLIYLIGGFLFETSVSMGGTLFGCLICTLLAEFCTFWCRTLDYSRPEFLEYEDDEYVYYVKAVPKMVVEKPDRQIHEISSRH